MDTDGASPLYWPGDYVCPSGLTRFMADVPIVGLWSRTKRKICGQLRCRRPHMLNAWGEDLNLLRHLVVVSSIIVNELEWPNPLFLPKDPVSILFFDPSMDLRAESAIKDICKLYRLPKKTFNDVKGWSYLDMMQTIIQASKEAEQ